MLGLYCDLGSVSFFLLFSDEGNQLLLKDYFDQMLNTDSDEIIIFWPNDFGLVNFLKFLAMSDKREQTFIKEVFWSKA